MKLRIIGAGAAAVLAATALAACDTKVGTAAIIDGHRISQSHVNKYIDASFTYPSSSDPSQQQPPRVLALNTIIESRLMSEVLERSYGGLPSDSELAALHDKALAVQFGTQQTGSQADESLRSGLTKGGFEPAFVPLFIRQFELTQAVIDKTKARQRSDLGAAVNKLGIKVTVNPRYGSWSAADVSLTSTVHHDFLTTGSPTSPTPSPSTG